MDCCDEKLEYFYRDIKADYYNYYNFIVNKKTVYNWKY